MKKNALATGVFLGLFASTLFAFPSNAFDTSSCIIATTSFTIDLSGCDLNESDQEPDKKQNTQDFNVISIRPTNFQVSEAELYRTQLNIIFLEIINCSLVGCTLALGVAALSKKQSDYNS